MQPDPLGHKPRDTMAGTHVAYRRPPRHPKADRYRCRGDATCALCGATFTAKGDDEPLCAVCRDHPEAFPSGILTLGGEGFTRQRKRILSVIAGATRAATLDRAAGILSVDLHEDRAVVAFADWTLARIAAEAVQRAFKGRLDYRVIEQPAILRAHWYH